MAEQGTAFPRLARPSQTWRSAIRPNRGAVIHLQESHVDPSETRMSPLAKGGVHICYSLLTCYQS
ncbi:hypothetical protein Nmel_010971 [Mimus melanotis]